MEIVIVLFILLGGSIAFSAWKKSKSSDESSGTTIPHEPLDKGRSNRKCSACGHEGEMQTWLSHYTPPKLIAVAGFLLGYIPGLIFLACYWGKYKCPACGAIGKNHEIAGAPQ